jgi:uncharacterized repeat protein (TIGR02543 family)
MPAAMTLGLSAAASAGYTFTTWTGDCAGATPGIFVNLAGPRTRSAIFTPRQEGARRGPTARFSFRERLSTI